MRSHIHGQIKTLIIESTFCTFLIIEIVVKCHQIGAQDGARSKATDSCSPEPSIKCEHTDVMRIFRFAVTHTLRGWITSDGNHEKKSIFQFKVALPAAPQLQFQVLRSSKAIEQLLCGR